MRCRHNYTPHQHCHHGCHGEPDRSGSGTPDQNAARELAEKLMTNGIGELAQRLVLTIDKPAKRDLGGWNFNALVGQLLCALAQAERRGRVAAYEKVQQQWHTGSGGTHAFQDWLDAKVDEVRRG